MVEDIAMGHTVIVRKGKRVLYMILFGAKLTTEQLTALLGPYVVSMETYKP